MTEAEKAYRYFVIAVPENEEQAKAYFWARKALQSTLTPPAEDNNVPTKAPNEPLTLEELHQPVDQLRLLRKTYPELWSLMLKWDADSPVTFKADGHTVHDYDRRFAAEDAGCVPTDRKFRWKMIEEAVENG